MEVFQSRILHLGAILLLGMLRAAYGQASCNIRNAKQYGLIGHVQSVLTQYPGESGNPPALLSRLLFDQGGRVLEDAHVIQPGQYQVFRYLYSRASRDYEIDMFTASSLSQHARRIDLQRHLIRFDSQGRCVEERDIDTDGETEDRTIYEYPDPHSVRQTDFNSDGTIFSLSELKFDASQHLISEKATESPNGAWSREYRYDKDGKQTDLFSYRNGVLEAHWISSYDDQNRLASDQLIVADPQKDQHVYGTCGDCGLSSGKTTYRYDAGGRLKEKSSFDPDGKLRSFTSYEYDDRGTITRELHSGTGSEGVPVSTFAYDLIGNWTHKLAPDGKSTADRTIDYY